MCVYATPPKPLPIISPEALCATDTRTQVAQVEARRFYLFVREIVFAQFGVYCHRPGQAHVCEDARERVNENEA